MPKVRTYQQGQVQPNAVPSVRYSPNATAESFGGGKAKQIQALGAGLQAIGDGASKLAAVYQAKSQERKDRSLVRDSLNKAESDMRNLEGEMNRPENRENALDAYSVAQKNLTEMRKKYVSELKNDRQRDLFIASFDSQMNGVLDRSYALQEKSRVEFDRLTRDAQNQSAIDNAVSARTDEKAIKESEMTIVANTAASTVGLPKDVRKKAVADAVHNLHNSVYSALMADDPRAAVGYLEKNKDKFNGKAYEVLKKEADDKAFDWQAREDAAKLVNSGLTDDEIEKELAKIQDPKKADALTAQVKKKLEDRNIAREIQQKEGVYSAWQNVLQGGDIPYGRLNGTEIKAMETYKRAELQGFAQDSDRSLLTSLGRLTDQELQQIDEVTMAGYGQSLNQSDFEAIFTRYRDLRRSNQAGIASDKLTQIRSDAQMVSDALSVFGIDTSISKHKDRSDKRIKETQKEKQLINDLNRSFEREINDREKATGRKLAPQEKQEILDGLLIRGKVRNIFGSKDTTFLFETAEADLEKNFSVKDIPIKLQQQMEEAFKLRNVPATPDNIRNYYLEYLRSRKK